MPRAALFGLGGTVEEAALHEHTHAGGRRAHNRWREVGKPISVRSTSVIGGCLMHDYNFREFRPPLRRWTKILAEFSWQHLIIPIV